MAVVEATGTAVVVARRLYRRVQVVTATLWIGMAFWAILVFGSLATQMSSPFQALAAAVGVLVFFASIYLLASLLFIWPTTMVYIVINWDKKYVDIVNSGPDYKARFSFSELLSLELEQSMTGGVWLQGEAIPRLSRRLPVVALCGFDGGCSVPSGTGISLPAPLDQFSIDLLSWHSITWRDRFRAAAWPFDGSLQQGRPK